jgi:hypothetical protein
MMRSPPNGVSRTSRVCPGSKKTFVPAGTASRMPHADARSKSSVRLTSKKWKCDVTPTITSPRFTTLSASPSSHCGSTSHGSGGPSRAIGSCRTIRRLPSANRASTSTRGTSAATPSSTSFSVSASYPAASASV